MSERPTPETDAVEFEVIDDYECGINVVSSTLARKLERDLAEAKANASRTCQWTEDEDGNWDTGCGECFSFADGKPSQNKQRFCGYCGGRLVEKEYRYEQET